MSEAMSLAQFTGPSSPVFPVKKTVDLSGTRYGASVVLMNHIVRNGLYVLGKVLFGSFKIKCDKICIRPEF